MNDLDSHIETATHALLARQQADGHFLFELEADATVPAEFSRSLSLLQRVMDTLEILYKPQRLAPARFIVRSAQQ